MLINHFPDMLGVALKCEVLLILCLTLSVVLCIPTSGNERKKQIVDGNQIMNSDLVDTKVDVTSRKLQR